MIFLIFLSTIQSFMVMANPYSKPRGDTLTVANVTEDKSGNDVTVTFLESQRFYKLERSNKNFKSYITLLHESGKKNIPLIITFTEPNGDIIKNVEKIHPGNLGK